MKDIMNGYIAAIGWTLLLLLAVVISVDMISVYVSTQGYMEAASGAGVTISLVAALAITAIVVGARHYPTNHSLIDDYS
ncbi:hypothetical protein AAIR29_07350 [Psychrobacter sp. FBL11]|uniref:Uncharacterized protein n=1 Tax=Psychrobacter saeujeotis TaxID=3143436 RepID=A0ABU9X7T6_9GAMM|nr:hypothetical protein [uncultured Psychrobacter sp.]